MILSKNPKNEKFNLTIVQHPSYTQFKDNEGIVRSTNNDIALIKLDRPTSLMPVCMPYNIKNPNSFPFDDAVINLYSWGKTSMTNNLKKLK